MKLSTGDQLWSILAGHHNPFVSTLVGLLAAVAVLSLLLKVIIVCFGDRYPPPPRGPPPNPNMVPGYNRRIYEPRAEMIATDPETMEKHYRYYQLGKSLFGQSDNVRVYPMPGAGIGGAPMPFGGVY